MKTCRYCGKTKDLSLFGLKNEKPRAYCKACASEMAKRSQAKRRIQDPEGFKAARVRVNLQGILRKYGLQPEELEKMGDLQGWNCAICNTDIIDKPYVDHNHVTNKVRALLCFHCNVGLGHFKDQVALLEKAAAYLVKHAD